MESTRSIRGLRLLQGAGGLGEVVADLGQQLALDGQIGPGQAAATEVMDWARRVV